MVYENLFESTNKGHENKKMICPDAVESDV